MRICFATSECVPFAKAGGLADVSGALPVALSKLGCQVKLFLPRYDSIDPRAHDLVLVEELRGLSASVAGRKVPFSIWYGILNSKVEVYLVDCPHYCERDQPDTSDEDERFILFQNAVLKILQQVRWAPDIIHCNDWQTGLLPVYTRSTFNRDHFFDRTGTLLSIHNVALQGNFPQDTISKAGLSFEHYYPGGPFEFNDNFSFLKTGIMFSDIVTTVSRNYAREIQTPFYGAGLGGVLHSREKDLFGIVNGIDTNVWNPQSDEFIPYRYSSRNLAAKKRNKKALVEYAGLVYDEKIPLIGIISRLTHQKGLDLLQEVLPEIMELPLQFILLGSGEKAYEDFYRRAARTYRKQFVAYLGFNNELAHQITAGSDIFLMPSLHEPCGLNQMYSLNYGTLPIVRRTGGLTDTVRDYHEYYKRGNGFAFNDFTPEALGLTIRRALDLYKKTSTWKSIMKRAMQEDFSWGNSARKYMKLYRKIRDRRLSTT